MKNRSIFIILSLLVTLWCLSGCQKTYYALWEQFGKEKRHLLRENVKEASEEQKEASEQFKDVLTRIQEMYGFTGGDLEKVYKKLQADFAESEKRAEVVHKRIAAVETIAGDLFHEWEDEIKQITNPALRSKSRQRLEESRVQYGQLRAAMKKAESKMSPVLDRFRDYVLYLKHNLNAQAVGTLREEAGNIEIEVGSLIADMNRSITEAEVFLKNFQ
ncbi:MAG: DUF2959 domain-containing protein [Deltaproteobacteria bacterium]|nr:DUF2959 domain-containing protein [Deltaproteobacteria bacterium]